MKKSADIDIRIIKKTKNKSYIYNIVSIDWNKISNTAIIKE